MHGKRHEFLRQKPLLFTFFDTLVPVLIPPIFHELFHYKLAAVVVCDFHFPYQMESAVMLSPEFINFDFSWYIRNMIPPSTRTSSHMKVYMGCGQKSRDYHLPGTVH